jgi:poly(beta-D-mannuronate) lyase
VEKYAITKQLNGKMIEHKTGKSNHVNDTRKPNVLGAIFLLSFVSGAGIVLGEQFKVADVRQLESVIKGLEPGDEVVLAAGEWRDAELRVEAIGTREKPVVFRAELPGKTIFTGASRVRISGKFVELRGIQMVNSTNPKNDWLEFRYDSKRWAENCSVSNCAFVEDESFASSEKENRWIGIYGQFNELSNCRIQGKKNKGATLVVWLGEKDLGNHKIVNNYFGKRPLLGKNGGETIRVGDSKTSMQSSRCLIENNVFEQCDGETECISNKSCENIYRGNTFREVQGTLSLRHGNRCLVEKNVFLGNRRNQTGGIRVMGEDHRILSNYLADLEGDGFRTAITLINGIPDSPDNGYVPVQRVIIDGNTINNCEHSVLLSYNDDRKATVLPSQVTFRNQRIVARKGKKVFEVGDLKRMDEVLNEIQFEGNQVQAGKLGIELRAGIEQLESITFDPPRGLNKDDVGPVWRE